VFNEGLNYNHIFSTEQDDGTFYGITTSGLLYRNAMCNENEFLNSMNKCKPCSIVSTTNSNGELEEVINNSIGLA
jgi:hypothetical protein